MRTLAVIVILAAVCGVSSSVWADAALDAKVQAAIEKEITHLWKSQKPDGSWGPAGSAGQHAFNYHPQGPSALAMYALLEAGESPQDPRMIKALDFLSKDKSDRTYTLGLRCQVWLLAATKADETTREKYIKLLRDDVRQLYENVHADGSYGYGCGPGAADNKPNWFDNSNSQYGVLGAWAGVRAHPPVEIPTQYWQAVLKHWLVQQSSDGGWTYKGQGGAKNPSISTMTAAGIATLYVCVDNLFAEKFITCGDTSKELQPIEKGLDWMEAHFKKGGEKDPKARENQFPWYYLYGVERVALASGYRYFGSVDWYKWGCGRALSHAGTGSAIDAAFRLLFFIRGQRPIVFNRLEYSGDWNNRPRAIASLTDWLNLKFECGANWQIVSFKVPLNEWHDAPVTVISGNKMPKFTGEEIRKLRLYVEQGGTILTCNEGSGEQFSAGIRKVIAQIFPQYELRKCTPDDDLYNVYFKVVAGSMPLNMVSNGVRPLVIHSDKDLPLSWQLRKVATEKIAYDAAANIYMYVTDKGKGLRHRGVSLWPEGVADAPGGTKIAILKWGGNFNPEPLAYKRFELMMRRDYSLNVDPAVVEIDKLDNEHKVAVLAGTGELHLGDAQKQALKKYVEGGGVLLVNATGGSKAFADSAKPLVTEMFGDLQLMASTAPLYSMSGVNDKMKIDKFKYRRKAAARLGGVTEPQLRAVLDGNRAKVLFSQEDIVAGLLGNPCYGIDGYEPDTAFALMRNIVVSALSGGNKVETSKAPKSEAKPSPKPAPKTPSKKK